MSNEKALTTADNIQVALLDIVQRKDIDPERLERFLDLQIKMEDRQSEKLFNEAMAKFQGDCPIIKRNKKVEFGKTKYDYSPLDEIIHVIKPLLTRHGLAYSFNTIAEGEQTRLITTISHLGGHSKDFSYISDSLHDDARMNVNQRRKSAMTYSKRACLENALGIVTAGEDDDASRLTETLITQAEIDEIEGLVKSTNTEMGKVLSFLKVEKLQDLSSLEVKKARNLLIQKRASCTK